MTSTIIPVEEFEARCRARGVPITVQRRSIFTCLARRLDHPTAEQVYETVRGQLQSVSRPTVYRVLETLVELGVARKIHHQGQAARFDANVGRHHHLICSSCASITDLEDDGPPVALPPARGFTITDYSISFAGLCAPCQEKNRKDD